MSDTREGMSATATCRQAGGVVGLSHDGKKTKITNCPAPSSGHEAPKPNNKDKRYVCQIKEGRGGRAWWEPNSPTRARLDGPRKGDG